MLERVYIEKEGLNEPLERQHLRVRKIRWKPRRNQSRSKYGRGVKGTKKLR